MKRKILKSKVSGKQYKRFDFERVVIEKSDTKEGDVKKKRVLKPKDEKPVEKKKSNVTQKYASVGYCSIKNFREIIREMSDSREKFASCLNQFIEAVTEIVLDEGGRLERFLNNGILFYFPSDKSLSDGTTRAVTASLKIRYRMNKLNRSWEFYRDDAWQIRVGVNTGMVLIEEIEDDKGIRTIIKGQTAELARGMGSTADAGKILITDTTYNDSGFKRGYFKIEEPYHMHVKGTDFVTKVREITGMIRG